jgi:hypothetical protein
MEDTETQTMREGTGRVCDLPNRKKGIEYHRMFLYIPSAVAKDTSFPFKKGDHIRVRIDNDKLSIEKEQPSA